VVAPTVFRLLPEDHARAGQVAGQIFAVGYWCAAGLGVLILLLAQTRRPRPVLSALLLVVLSGFQLGYIVPLVAAHGLGWPFSFAALHATASVIHLALAVTALALSWMLSQPVGAPALAD
jgi:hypothetical protein